MGLLDDAIREHLELKRLHGADASEVARQEHEALGPVRREDIAIPDADPMPEPVAHEASAPLEPTPVDEAPDAGVVAPPAVTPEPVAPQPEPVLEVPAPPVEPVADDVVAAVPGDDEEPGQKTVAFSLEDLHAAEAVPAPPAEPVAEAPAAPAPPVTPETVAPDVVPADEEPGEHDELEETPEFLQETPEHDRLWFEQKPPRDFDF